MAYNHRAIEEMYIEILQKSREARSGLKSSKVNEKFSLRSSAYTLKDLRIAAIMDTFTYTSYEPECQLIQLMPDEYMEQIDSFKPDMLFIESAWNGKGNTWFRKVDRLSAEICSLAGYCRAKGIPIVFWNKEDPVSLAAFMDTASLCDYVFTTDIDAVVQYKLVLGHERVFHLHFAAQPKYHNPIEEYERKDKVCFAGAYYPRYPERMKTMEVFTNFFAKNNGIDIYDRNYNNPDSPYAFPELYRPFIVGTLNPEEISIAYKGYKYGMNMNSISQSQTMFARRVFELMASNTVVVGNYSKGVKNYFGDLTICTESADTLEKDLKSYCGDKSLYEKYRLLGLRKVLLEHLYEDRLDDIVETVFGVSLKRALPKIYVLTCCASKDEKDRIKKMLEWQSYKSWEMVDINEEAVIGKYEESFFTSFSGENYYGKNYLLDLVLSMRYIQKDGYGKPDESGIPYSDATMVMLESAIINKDLLEGVKFSRKMKIKGDFFLVDRMNYKRNYDLDNCEEVDDLEISNQGIYMKALHRDDCQKTKIAPDSHEIWEKLDAQEIYGEAGFSDIIRGRMVENQMKIESSLSKGNTQYVILKKNFVIEEYMNAGKIGIGYNVEGSLNAIGVCWFFNQQNHRMGVEIIPLNQTVYIKPPQNASTMKLGLHIVGSGEAFIDSIQIRPKTTFIRSHGTGVCNKGSFSRFGVYRECSDIPASL